MCVCWSDTIRTSHIFSKYYFKLPWNVKVHLRKNQLPKKESRAVNHPACKLSMSAGESLYKGMFTGHVSLHLHWNSCPKTPNMHTLHCHRLLYAGPYIVAENQLRPCGQRTPYSWVNLNLFISIMWVEDSKEQPLTCDCQHCKPHRWSHLKVDLNQSLLLNYSSSDSKPWSQLSSNSPWLQSSGLQIFFTWFKIQLAEKLLKGLCLWTYSKGSQTQEHLWQPHTPVQWQQYWHMGNCHLGWCCQ